MSYSSIALVALIVHLIINVDVFKPTTEDDIIPAHDTYRGFLICITLYYITDALWGLLYTPDLIDYCFVDSEVYFIVMAMAVMWWTRYVVAYLKDESRFGKALLISGWVFLIIDVGSVIVNIFKPVLFRFDEEGVYQSGPMRNIILAMQLFMFLITSAYAVIVMSGHENSSKIRHTVIGAFGVAMIVLVCVQAFYPVLPLYSIGFLIGTCLMHTFILEDEKDLRRLELEDILRRENLQRQELGSARLLAYTDQLTGVRNKNAYTEAEKNLNDRISKGELSELAVVVFDVNELKNVNDTKGHEAGDEHLQNACALICKQFKHSPIYRIGGDEFVAHLEGEDFLNRKILLEDFDNRIEENQRQDKVVIATGLGTFIPGEDTDYSSVFERADKKMYERKHFLKGLAMIADS